MGKQRNKGLYGAMAENLCPTPRNLATGAGGHSSVVEAGLGSLAPPHRKLTLRLTIPLSSFFFQIHSLHSSVQPVSINKPLGSVTFS